MSGVGAGRRVRPVNIAPNQVRVRTGADGSVYMESTTPLGPYPIRLTDRLDHWAAAAPDRVFLAQRPTPSPGPTATPSPTPTPICIVVPDLTTQGGGPETVAQARAEWAAAGFTGGFAPATGQNNKIVTSQSPGAGGACVPASTAVSVTHT
jgi:hypothetical protein